MGGDLSGGTVGLDFVEQSFPITVKNVDPELTTASIDSIMILEGDSVVSGVFSDPGFDNPFNTGGETAESIEYLIDWGDGKTSRSVATIDSPGSADMDTIGSFVVSHRYVDAGDFTVSVTVLDDDDGSSQTMEFPVSVENVDPVLTLNPVVGTQRRRCSHASRIYL